MMLSKITLGVRSGVRYTMYKPTFVCPLKPTETHLCHQLFKQKASMICISQQVCGKIHNLQRHTVIGRLRREEFVELVIKFQVSKSEAKR